ncbi:MAG: von Willebrand factor type A domain-containing protein [Carboxylicivirga sp.]|jgi:Ca-activated chloride channel family protein|nr:von Willebrand factor type A domain-containing protein [Carboxylicivirga sp.]
MKKIALLLITGLMLLSVSVLGQQKSITGYVTDESGVAMPGVNVIEKNTVNGTITNSEGYFKIKVYHENAILQFAFIGFESQEVKVKEKTVINVTLKQSVSNIEEVVVTGYASQKKISLTGSAVCVTGKRKGRRNKPLKGQAAYFAPPAYTLDYSNEKYASVSENGYKEVTKEPLSTFSVDVDRASYTNIRRFLNNGQLPPKDAIRIEEMVNYFDYDYARPEGEHPFSVNPELATCPWNDEHYLLKVGLKGMEIDKEDLPPSNLVFLLDVSGSMNSVNKLPLLKSSFRLLVNELRAEDRVSIVVYAGAAGVVLKPTSGNKKKEILDALDRLEAGGSTAGGAGLKLAYKLAKENYRKHGNNRIILATDGDFNVGISSNQGMEDLVEEERNNGVYMTVLGFGMGNYKDDRMEIIADKGNGNYAYIDNLQEAQKTLVSEFGGTLFTIAKDVKFQIEFNPSKVLAYRLIGYENRLLNDEDFNDDTKDAGEIGAGHTVTALYEIIPVGAKDSKDWISSVDPLKYQKKKYTVQDDYSNEWLTLKLRYKKPNKDKSILLKKVLEGKVKDFNKASDDFRFAASVAGFGMVLRDSPYMGELAFDSLQSIAKKARGDDEQGFKAEMVRLMKTAESLSIQYAAND